jgi:uncharacterized iron-regulated membrane protein
VKQDWPIGHTSDQAEQTAASPPPIASSEHAAHMRDTVGKHEAVGSPQAYAAIDKMVATVAPLNLAPPVLISPPAESTSNWTAKSDAQNRPLRVDLVLDGSTGEILKRENFKDHPPIDQVVGFGVAAHEGQLFGWPNQLLNVLTALGLILMSVSSVMMWWRRRPQGVLGAPDPIPNSRVSFGLGILILMFGIYLPLFGISMIVVKLIEKQFLRRIPAVRNWLGLNMAASGSG